MTLELILGAMLVGALTFYLLFGGADFGAGIWTAFATGPDGQRQRALVDRAIGPIWEANHVWLIIAVTILFTAFPPAFAVISTRLHIPLTAMLIGIVLRGTAFAIRTHDISSRPDGFTNAPRVWHGVFALSSLFTPIMLGLVLGAVASGRAAGPSATFLETFVAPWLALFPAAVGLLAAALVAYLAAVYLTIESDDPALRRLFRRRAVASWFLVVGLGGAALALSKTGAPEIYRGLLGTGAGRSAVAVTAGLLLAGLWSLLRRRDYLARLFAAAGAVAVLWGWALSQFPYLVEPSVTIYDAAPPVTLRILLGSLLGGSVLLFPFLSYLYRLFKGEFLTHRGV
ncbi:cytochrome d ubiquinol oxidase subunit II [Nitrospira moscoviensis]|uniref:Putative terminal oxidase subunit II n=1 Tax=Nitrospira moscoviensis TaxID=42253 RepID=A0A0K2GDH1_NITMO|nr:cytochrome d ubiquinol oxidase subunit II [Nitrospira moscoviensis]ALA59001.1 putative terminal oxidase subunit II [Nitrospira moscoviensis]